MRLSRLFLVGFLALRSAHAWAGECERDGIVLFPAPGAVVPTNAQFILQGIGQDQTRVQELISTETMALVSSDSEAVAIKVEKSFVSPMQRVAVKLRPLKPLRPRVEYTLALPAKMAGARLLNDPLGIGKIRWLTGNGPDATAPRFRAKPASSQGFYESTPDGLRRELRLRAVVEEQSAAWVLVTLQRVRGSTTRQQFPVPVEAGVIAIGHDGCSGSFTFDDGRAYRATFELFDIAGNKSSEKVTVEVNAPRPLQ